MGGLAWLTASAPDRPTAPPTTFDALPPTRPSQRDYQRVLRAQAEAIKSLTSDVETLKQQLEFQLSAIATVRLVPSTALN